MPRQYEEMAALKRGMAERIELHDEAQAVLQASPPNLNTVAGLRSRYDALAHIGATQPQAAVEAALRELYDTTVAVFDAEAAEALRLIDRAAMESVLAKAQEYSYMTADLYDISDKLQLTCATGHGEISWHA